MPIQIDALQLLRLMQLASPALPVGGYTYSGGLEWAVEAGWVDSEAGLESWLRGLVEETLPFVDLALTARLYHARTARDEQAFSAWTEQLLALRETAELRAEETHRGRALAGLLDQLGMAPGASWLKAAERSQAGGLALAAADRGIPLEAVLVAVAWSWLEGQVVAGVKLVPLGQTAGQRVLYRLAQLIPAAVELGAAVSDAEVGASPMALAIASQRHETQYTRLFRS